MGRKNINRSATNGCARILGKLQGCRPVTLLLKTSAVNHGLPTHVEKKTLSFKHRWPTHVEQIIGSTMVQASATNAALLS